MTRCTATMNSTLRAALFSSIPAMRVSKRSPSISPEATLRCIPPMTASTPMAAAARWGSAAGEAAEQMECPLLRIFPTGICHPCRIPRRAECLRCREKCPERHQQTERCPGCPLRERSLLHPERCPERPRQRTVIQTILRPVKKNHTSVSAAAH